jgi:hypothetical protein
VKECDYDLTRFSAQVDSSRGGFSFSSAMTSIIGSMRYCANLDKHLYFLCCCTKLISVRGRICRPCFSSTIKFISPTLLMITISASFFTNLYWQVTFFGMLVCFLLQVYPDASGAQLNQDFDLTRQNFVAEERPIFKDTSAYAESFFPRFVLPVLICVDTPQVP